MPTQMATRTRMTATKSKQTTNVDDEKIMLRRLQFKFYQRRHRAKLKQKTIDLEKDVEALQYDIANLELRRQSLHDQKRLLTHHASTTGIPTRAAATFFQVFHNGYSPREFQRQFDFLRAVMLDTVEGPDYRGLDHLCDQFSLYDQYFSKFAFEAAQFQVLNPDDSVHVIVDCVLHLRLRRESVTLLCPNLKGHDDLVDQMAGSELHIPGKFAFIADASNMVSYFGGDFNLIDGLHALLGNLGRVAMCLEGSRLQTTGRIALVPTYTCVDPRMRLNYVLSQG